MLVALKRLKDCAPVGILNGQAYAQTQFPKEDPHWDPNDDQGYQHLENPRKPCWDAGRKEGKGHENEQNIRGPARDRRESQPLL
jgi:hypothetical protein